MQAVEADSEGTVKFDLMSASIGRPPEYSDFCANGAIDVGFGVLGHNPNRFLMTEVMGMPFMSIDPWAGSAASWLAFTKYGARYNEHKGVQLVGTWVHSEPYLHMRGEGLRTIDDLKGKKIRVGSAITGRIIQALGGTPVQLPPTEAQQAMMSSVADGITFPMESIEVLQDHARRSRRPRRFRRPALHRHVLARRQREEVGVAEPEGRRRCRNTAAWRWR